jgi:hypothetical protein
MSAAPQDEARADGDDDDEVGYSEDDHGEDEVIMRMGHGAQPRTPNGDRIAVFTSQQEQ